MDTADSFHLDRWGAPLHCVNFCSLRILLLLANFMLVHWYNNLCDSLALTHWHSNLLINTDKTEICEDKCEIVSSNGALYMTYTYLLKLEHMDTSGSTMRDDADFTKDIARGVLKETVYRDSPEENYPENIKKVDRGG